MNFIGDTPRTGDLKSVIYSFRRFFYFWLIYLFLDLSSGSFGYISDKKARKVLLNRVTQ